ncbi:hypothetical protein CR513_05864, partial [Mucuna pruriens]
MRGLELIGNRRGTDMLNMLIGVHLRKEMFLNLRKSKLLPMGDGPFRIQIRINDNAYYGDSNSFNIVDLSPFCASTPTPNLRSNSLQEGKHDMNMSKQVEDTQKSTRREESIALQGPMTRGEENPRGNAQGTRPPSRMNYKILPFLGEIKPDSYLD